MKKTMMAIVFSVVFLLLFSAYNDKVVVESTDEYTVPSLTLEREDTTISLQQLKGSYVLLSFWASTDAQSRVACNEYTSFAKLADSKEQFCLLSVNFDQSTSLFNEIVRRDNLNVETQFNVQDDKAETIKQDYHLENGYRSILVDPQGFVIATNPSAETLAQILNR